VDSLAKEAPQAAVQSRGRSSEGAATAPREPPECCSPSTALQCPEGSRLRRPMSASNTRLAGCPRGAQELPTARRRILPRDAAIRQGPRWPFTHLLPVSGYVSSLLPTGAAGSAYDPTARTSLCCRWPATRTVA